MKILQIHWRYDNFGGGERYFFDICDALEQQGHKIIVLSSHSSENYHRGGDRKEYFVEKSFGIRSGYKIRGVVENIIHNENPDVIHLHETLFFLSPLIIAKVISHFPTVQTLHTAFFFALKAPKSCQMENSAHMH